MRREGRLSQDWSYRNTRLHPCGFIQYRKHFLIRLAFNGRFRSFRIAELSSDRIDLLRVHARGHVAVKRLGLKYPLKHRAQA